MTKEEMVVAIVAISCVTAIATTIFSSIFKYANKRLDANNGNSQLNQKFFDDYIAFKRDVLSQLEYLKTTGHIPPKSNTERAEINLNGEEEIIRESPRLKNMLSQKK